MSEQHLVRGLVGFFRTRHGLLIAVLCVIPFGSGPEVGLIGAIAREWSVTPDQLSVFSTVSVAGGIGGAIFSGWLSLRIGQAVRDRTACRMSIPKGEPAFTFTRSRVDAQWRACINLRRPFRQS